MLIKYNKLPVGPHLFSLRVRVRHVSDVYELSVPPKRDFSSKFLTCFYLNKYSSLKEVKFFSILQKRLAKSQIKTIQTPQIYLMALWRGTLRTTGLNYLTVLIQGQYVAEGVLLLKLKV